MKSTLAATLSLLSTLVLAGPALASPNAPQFVVDIDHLLIDYVPDTPENRERFEHEGKKFVEWADTTTENRKILYFFAEGAPALVQRLVDVPGSTVTFYSTGLAARNEMILKQLTLTRGRDGKRTAFEIARNIVSGEDMAAHEHELARARAELNVPAPPPEHTAAFPNLVAKEKKDLLIGKTGFTAEALPWVILLDDVATNAYGDQIRNLLFAARPHKRRLGELSTAGWTLETNKLIRLAGKLETILRKVKETGLPPTHFMFDYQFEVRDGKLLYRTDLLTDEEVHHLGEATLHAADPSFRRPNTIRALPTDEGISFLRLCFSDAVEQLLGRPRALELFQLPQ